MAGTDYAAGAAYVDGAFVPTNEARLPIRDWGFTRSDATYDTLHVWNGRLFRPDDHLDRFEASLGRLRLKPAETRPAQEGIIRRCVALTGLRNAMVTILCTRGVPPTTSRDPRDCVNRLYAFSYPFTSILSPVLHPNGLDVHISSVRRIPPNSVDPRIKNFHWLDFVEGLFRAYEQGQHTVILVDEAGCIVEGAGFNVFLVRNGRLATPARGMLEGITRRTVLDIAAAENLTVEVRDVSVAELRAADEVFLTSTAGGIMPVAKLDGAPVGVGVEGANTTRIRTAYWAMHEDDDWASPINYEG